MKKNSLLVISAGVLWGLLGVFSRLLAAVGFDSAGVLIVRCGIAALFFGVTLLVRDPGMFKVRLRDFWCFFGAGICSLLLFTYCYIQTIAVTSLSTAAVLLYTAPSMVMLMSLFIFRERLTVSKVLALLLAFAGCCLVSGLGTDESALSAFGLICGLLSGFGYALYSIFARLAMDRGYSSLTVNFYSCLLAALGASAIWGSYSAVRLMFTGWENFLLCLATGVITCYMPYLLYTKGLSGMEAGRASIMASIEPVVATVAGIVVFREKLTLAGGCGVALVLAAIVILNLKHKAKS
ncbi:MAG TPA: EamA family transporter [Clostridiales bacterium]|nr:EamA family transporter [Clostridiales bacterium]